MDDEKFQERLDREYADNKIGDVDGDIEVDENGVITQEALYNAVDEFIESQKLRDRKLFKQFKIDEEGLTPELIPIMKKPSEIPEDPAILENERKELISKYEYMG